MPHVAKGVRKLAKDRNHLSPKERKEREDALAFMEAHPTAVDGPAGDRHDRFGRPTVMTREVINKLENAASLGCPLTECALYAGISTTCLYNYFEANPDFKDRLAEFRERPILKARNTVIRALDDPHYAFRYLAKRKRDEFGDDEEVKASVTATAADGTSVDLTLRVRKYEDPDTDDGRGAGAPAAPAKPAAKPRRPAKAS